MKADVLILGGGITGLSAALHSRAEALLVEREARVGGCLRSDYHGGYKIDRTGHLLHFRDPYVREMMFERLPIDWLHFDRRAEIQILQRRVPYPIQYQLAALPPEQRLACLMGYLDVAGRSSSLEDSFDVWARNSYGDALYRLFFEPYNRKLWQTELSTITADWAERFVPMPDRELVVRGALGVHDSTAFGYNATFSYPASGGSQAIPDAMAAALTHGLRTGVAAESVDPGGRRCTLSDGSCVEYRRLVSTLPLPTLLSAIRGVDPAMLELARGLRHNSILYFALGYRIPGEPPPWHWLYVPEAGLTMYRVGHLSRYAPDIAPPGCALLCAEIAFPGPSATQAPVDTLRGKVLEDLARTEIVPSAWTLEFEHVGVIDCAYVIYDAHRRQSLGRLRDYLESLGIFSVGRYGAWGYGSMGDAVLEGRACAERVDAELGCGRPADG